MKKSRKLILHRETIASFPVLVAVQSGLLTPNCDSGMGGPCQSDRPSCIDSCTFFPNCDF